MRPQSRKALFLLTTGIVLVLFGFSLLIAAAIPASLAQNTSKTRVKDPLISISDSKNRPGNLDQEKTVQAVGSSVSVTVTVTSLITTDPSLPDRFALSQNYPNPFNSSTIIQYDLPIPTHVTIEIYNMLGQKVRTLVNDNKTAGSYRVMWDGKTGSGHEAATGIYLYRIQSIGFVKTKKLLLIK